MRFVKRTFSSAVVLVMGAFAIPAEAKNHSEFFWQPGEMQFAGELAPRYQLLTFKETTTLPRASTVETDTTGFGLRLKFDFGIMDMLSVGLDTTWMRLTSEETSRSNGATGADTFKRGFSDILIPIRAFYEASQEAALYFGLTAGIHTGTERNNNNSSGQHRLAPYVGLGYQASDDLEVGMKTTFTYKFKGSFSTGNASVDSKNNHEWDLFAFGEYKMDNMRIGFDAGWRYTFAETIEQTLAGTALTYKTEAFSALVLDLYGRYEVMDNFHILPKINWLNRLSTEYVDTLINTTQNTKEWEYSQWIFELGFRYIF